MKEHLNQFIQQITADKKKLGIMICALAIGLLLWGRLLLQGVPRTATAEDPVKQTRAADNSDTEVDKSMVASKPLPVVHIDLPASPGRDLFGLDPSRYRRTPGGSQNNNRPKLAQITTDGDPRMAAVREEAMELRLESVLTGSQPRAYINGQLLKPGDDIEGFTLLKVTDRHVLLTKYDLFIRLRM